MNILVCIKRVPNTGARILLTDDQQEINTRNLGFAISPHEECAVEEALQIVEKIGGESTVLTLGPEVANEQLRDSLAMGVNRAILLDNGGGDWGAIATAGAIVAAVRAEKENGTDFDLLLFGNESADSGGFQVGIRVAHELDLPCVTGIKDLEIEEGKAIAKRDAGGGFEVFEVALPAVFTVREGINLPRFRTMPGRLRAKKVEIQAQIPKQKSGDMEKLRLVIPPEQGSTVEILAEGPAAAPKIVEILKELELV